MSEDLLNTNYKTDADISYDKIYDTMSMIPDLDTSRKPPDEICDCIYEFYKRCRYFFLFLCLVITTMICILYAIVIIPI